MASRVMPVLVIPAERSESRDAVNTALRIKAPFVFTGSRIGSLCAPSGMTTGAGHERRARHGRHGRLREGRDRAERAGVSREMGGPHVGAGARDGRGWR